MCNILTGIKDELAPWMASHMDINAMDISGAAKKNHTALREAGADNLKRIFAFGEKVKTERMISFLEAKTIWHTVGI
ncbi:unannotated protein [freshwater metagenome]|uniref:Unannotated protein n=1 Tax=freshwater metagenome TaxID=449393 RepID=A0A6J7AHC6_9ZZZZ